ncbi:cobaltochelatase subunit CobN [Rhizobiaceae bacterium BDR2-2]|uniref:Cobaltochelatase subunit CobN n=1 Tax=Ectorhizobium quercum TaxID=2965071 RepID=A0AAE3MZN7_9HYPH|nr:cobaltochelatase subunit CobN [Ectorhizobium quercum]MCX8998053.1 cobaltochelatase subunit CobN [Ectorhizobium quercum]
MHILAGTSSSLDDIAEPVDLRQPAADVLVLSFSPSDLSGLAAAWGEGDVSLGLTQLSELRHPFSTDLWIEKTGSKAKAVLVRILGGHDRWAYGVAELSRIARENGIALALLPGECSQRDERLEAASTVSPEVLAALLACFREGGPENLKRAVGHLKALARGETAEIDAAEPVEKAGFYRPGHGIVPLETLLAGFPAEARRIPLLFYRSMLLANDAVPIDALFTALERHGFAPLPLFVTGLKDRPALAFAEDAFAAIRPAAIVTATAFSSGTDERGETLFDRFDAPVFQVVTATTPRAGWAENRRGLNPADLAMHVVLPELDGRILAGAVSFKEANEAGLAFNRPEPDRVEAVADRIAAHLRLRATPRAERNLVILIPDYPSAPGRTGYAVGLDVPESVRRMLIRLKDEGYAVEDIPATARDLLDRLEGGETLPLSAYRAAMADQTQTVPRPLLPSGEKVPEGRMRVDAPAQKSQGEPPHPAAATFSPTGRRGKSREPGITGDGPALLPQAALQAVFTTWGSPEEDESVENGRFRFRAARFGRITVALAPDRGRQAERRADYHDPALAPRHALIAFGLWMRRALDAHAIVHVGAHGAIEWLPGKVVALSSACFPEVVIGSLPVVYPFIVSNPGEAAVAKRRIGAVTLGHLPPPLVGAELSPEQQKLEQLADEYAQAEGLDRNRRDRLAKLIVETARDTGVAAEAGVAKTDDPETALVRIDAFLCDLKDFSLKDGQHIFGFSPPGETDPARIESARAEGEALIAALDGRRIRPGPSGAPARGRRDVLPTGRNLYAADPRTMPTPTAYELGRRAAEEVLRRHLQDHGDWPQSIVMDLWGSASLRNGGEDVAHALALMGARPVWDAATGRVTGVEVLPPAKLGRPRIDVTIRMSGLFRDMFAALIALLDTTMRAIAAREEAPGDNPLAEKARREGRLPPRLFGSAPGTYGAGIEDRLSSGDWQAREALGEAYLAMTSHAFSGENGEAEALPGRFAEAVRDADLLVHTGDDPGRDLLDGSADVAFIGGFSAAVAALGGKADVIALDTTDPARPRARSVSEAVARVVRGRAVSPRFIAGQMRHGPRGAAELVETVDRLVGFAETTEAIQPSLIEAVFDAYLGDGTVRDFLTAQNPEGARFMAKRFLSARRRNLWHPRRNSIDALLESLLREDTEATIR